MSPIHSVITGVESWFQFASSVGYLPNEELYLHTATQIYLWREAFGEEMDGELKVSAMLCSWTRAQQKRIFYYSIDPYRRYSTHDTQPRLHGRLIQ